MTVDRSKEHKRVGTYLRHLKKSENSMDSVMVGLLFAGFSKSNRLTNYNGTLYTYSQELAKGPCRFSQITSCSAKWLSSGSESIRKDMIDERILKRTNVEFIEETLIAIPQLVVFMFCLPFGVSTEQPSTITRGRYFGRCRPTCNYCEGHGEDISRTSSKRVLRSPSSNARLSGGFAYSVLDPSSRINCIHE